jgi:chemotaxis protein MotB
MQSRLKTLEVQVGAQAATVEPIAPVDAEAETAVDAEPVEVREVDTEVSTVIGAVPDARSETTGEAEREELRAQLASLITERNQLHELLEQNEEALRDGVAAAAQQQQQTDRLQVELNAAQAAVASLTTERDKLHELMEQNEEALRDGVANGAQQQQQTERLQVELTAAQAAVTAAKAGLGDKLAGLEQQHQQALAAVQIQLKAANEKLAALEAAADSGRQQADASVAQRASLQEQLVAVQADKAALETRLSEQEEAMAVLQADNGKAGNQVATLEQTLADARAHGNSLAEQLAAIQADTQGLEAKLLQQAGQLQVAHERSQARAAAPEEAKPSDAGGITDAGPEQELMVCETEEARLRDRAKALEEELAQTLERELKEQQQLQGAVAQTKALQQEVLGLKGQREERDKEIQAMEVDWEHCRNRAAEDLGKQIVGDGSGAIIKAHPAAATPKDTLDLEQAQVLQTLLEESQALLEACNASLGAGARDLFVMEQEILGLKNAMQRQRRVAASRVRLLAMRLNQAMADVRLHHGPGPGRPVPGPGPGPRPVGGPPPR